MKTLINQFTVTLVLQIVGPVDENQWIVSAGQDSKGTALNFVASIGPAVRATIPDLQTGDFVRATVTTVQYLDPDGALSAQSDLSTVYPWECRVFMARQ